MATREQLRDVLSARPFRPYMITLADGQTFTIRHPELVACDVRGRDLQINTDDGLVRVECVFGYAPGLTSRSRRGRLTGSPRRPRSLL